MRMRIFPPDSQLFNSQLTYYVRGDESRQAQNAIIEFTISLKTRKRNLFTTHLNVGLRYIFQSLYSEVNVAKVEFKTAKEPKFHIHLMYNDILQS